MLMRYMFTKMARSFIFGRVNSTYMYFLSRLSRMLVVSGVLRIEKLARMLETYSCLSLLIA